VRGKLARRVREGAVGKRTSNLAPRPTAYLARLPAHHAAMVQWSMTIIMSRRLAQHRRNARQLPPILAT
jgi:hypothetical protein